MNYVNVNGSLFDPAKDTPVISAYDRGFLFGDSIYEVVKTQNRQLVFWPEHYERLVESAKKIGMELPFSYDEITNEILKTLKASDEPSAYTRLVVSRGNVKEFSLNPEDTHSKGNYVIFVRDMAKLPKDSYTKGVEMTVSSVQRNSVKALDPAIKSGNYLNNLLAHKEAQERQVYDAIMLNERDEVVEGPTFNLFFVKDDVYYTPHLAGGMLKGITRKVLIKALESAGKKVQEKTLFLDDLKNADECFATSSTKELVPITKIDDTVYGNEAGKGYKEARALYDQFRDSRTQMDGFKY